MIKVSNADELAILSEENGTLSLFKFSFTDTGDLI